MKAGLLSIFLCCLALLVCNAGESDSPKEQDNSSPLKNRGKNGDFHDSLKTSKNTHKISLKKKREMEKKMLARERVMEKKMNHKKGKP
jgi:hypothetical protein